MSRENEEKILRKEAEEEERELREYDRRLRYMSESCTEGDMDIWRLIEEQQEMLLGLKMRNEEFSESLSNKNHFKMINYQ